MATVSEKQVPFRAGPTLVGNCFHGLGLKIRDHRNVTVYRFVNQALPLSQKQSTTIFRFEIPLGEVHMEGATQRRSLSRLVASARRTLECALFRSKFSRPYLAGIWRERGVFIEDVMPIPV